MLENLGKSLDGLIIKCGMIEISKVPPGYCVGESGSYEVSYESFVVYKRDKGELEQNGSCGGGKMRLSSGYILKGEWDKEKEKSKFSRITSRLLFYATVQIIMPLTEL